MLFSLLKLFLLSSNFLFAKNHCIKHGCQRLSLCLPCYISSFAMLQMAIGMCKRKKKNGISVTYINSYSEFCKMKWTMFVKSMTCRFTRGPNQCFRARILTIDQKKKTWLFAKWNVQKGQWKRNQIPSPFNQWYMLIRNNILML